ncbi:ABC transporter ATP-binding protein [Motiliproteus sp. MSK22-1]|uniref:ABC transporter ATP-binding protein n=1 Tax=Motiliproteus sp. MSK22-1 TaxID=1897630 RepID=UPI000977E050|nr:ABC transporter ATP-binding protein [Motiliproteus sp. MSK22-1]OMH33636.1 copper ABC transporter ATP-binding protein [Motiliproteus sp. MSK22-1]
MNIVELDNVEKRYEGVHALKNLNLALQQGEILGLFGHNGAGKTTTIKLILGLIEASKGKVRVFGEDPTRSEARNQRRKLGFLQENVSFYDQLTGLEVLNYFARLKGVSKKQSLALLDQVGLRHAEKRRVKTYSKGMRQRLGLAQALLGEPKLLLLDEPTVGLDPIATQDFYQRLEQLKERGCTIILCSHVLPGVEKYIDRALIMGQGNLLAQGNLNDLRREANLPVTMKLEGNIQLPEKLQSAQVTTSEGLQLQVPIQEKMQVLQSVMAISGLENLDLHLPTLEDLYTHFTGTMQIEAERS